MTLSFMKEFEHLKIQLEEIKRATNSFRNQVIGTGGFGDVYEGEASHSMGRRSIVAIKRLNRQFGQGDPEFLKEIMMLSRCTHQNLVSLLGFCDEEDEKVLVYEFASKGSLDRRLSDTGLTWLERIKICLGAAKGLCYLHDPKGTHQRVLHCDIKSANILLDESLTAKVADFGLSKMGPANQQYSVVVTNALGTPGYCDPLFMTTYTLTKESDVYSFGVVLFEVLCGRLCYEYSNGQTKVFVNMWKEKYSENKLNEIVFQHLEPQMDPISLKLFSGIAFQCLHNSREGRPTMSIVVEKLEKALTFQDLRQKLPEVYKEILNVADGAIPKINKKNVAVPPARFKSMGYLNKLLSNGVFLNYGKTWFTINDHGEHYVMISLAECLIPTGSGAYRYYVGYNSRFEVGCYSTYGRAFKTRAKTQFLSPLITYRVNLVCKLTRSDQSYKHEHLPLRYTLKGEKKVSIVHLANKREDEWLKANLYQFTSHDRNVDLEIYFDNHHHCYGLEIDGIEFQPLEEVEVELHHILELKYGEILKSVAHPLLFKSEVELNVLLSKGILLNEGKTWFSRNDKGVHYVFQSVEECLIEEVGESYDYVSGYNSRFPVGSYYTSKCRFKACVKTEFLSPLTTYTVNLVFKFEDENETASKQGLIWLDYKLDGETYNQVSHFAYKREDNWWTVELYHFTSNGTYERENNWWSDELYHFTSNGTYEREDNWSTDGLYHLTGTIFDLKIIFEGSLSSVIVDGIEFLPLEKVELQDLESDQKHVNLEQTLSDSEDDTYWKNKLPTNYKDIIKFSEQGLQGTTNKELYYILSKGLHINYKPPFSFFQRPTNHRWCFLDKNGKTCLTLPARAVCMLKNLNHIEWRLLSGSRYWPGLVIYPDSCKYIVIKENKFRVLSPRTQYACYLVYKTERGGCTSPIEVWHKDKGLSKWEYGSHIYLVSPQTPVVRRKAGQNTHNPLYRPKFKRLPQKGSDGWMEVQVWEFQTDPTMTVIPSLRLEYQGLQYLNGLTILGIEFRPI